MFIKDFQHYVLNQPIDYNHNLVLYLINLFYRVYENTIKISKTSKQIFIKINEEKMRKLYTLRSYKDYIFTLINNNNNQINKEIDDKLDSLFLYLESEKFPDDLEEIIKSAIENNDIKF